MGRTDAGRLSADPGCPHGCADRNGLRKESTDRYERRGSSAHLRTIVHPGPADRIQSAFLLQGLGATEYNSDGFGDRSFPRDYNSLSYAGSFKSGENIMRDRNCLSASDVRAAGVEC